MALTVGSLCSGYEGIGLGLSAAGIEHRTAFVADPDRGATTVLEARLPGVPNLGDITTTDWRTVMPVDLLTAGYPCQPFSLAGQRKGTKDVRHLWPHIADAVRVVRPRWVLLENVSGHRSLGFGRVLADLAALGYVGSWVSVRASDVGAAHKRERVFIHAWREGDGPIRVAAAGPGRGVGADPVLSLLPTPRTSDTNGAGHHGDGGMDLRTLVTLLPTPTSQNSHGNHRNNRGDLLLPGVVQLLPTPSTGESPNGHGRRGGRPGNGRQSGALLDALGTDAAMWGQFAPAIARWEAVTGRPAPDPTELGKTGMRLSPRFVEWLMGLPAGYVTDLVGRNDALRLLGNGVVPQQLAYALGQLTGVAA